MRMESGECHSPEMEEEGRILSGKTDEAIFCKNEDYETAEVIGCKMLMHTTMPLQKYEKFLIYASKIVQKISKTAKKSRIYLHMWDFFCNFAAAFYVNIKNTQI